MEKLTYCGCDPDLPSPQSLTERAIICGTCAKVATCFYPATINLRMAKSASEEESTEEQEENLQDLARQSHDFASFHQKTTKRDKLDRESDRILELTQEHDRQYKQPQKNNLQQIARESLYFGEFHSKAQDV